MKLPKVSAILVCSLLLASIVATVSLFITSFGADPLEPRLRDGVSADSKQAASASSPSQAANSYSGPATAAQQSAPVAATTTNPVSSLTAAASNYHTVSNRIMKQKSAGVPSGSFCPNPLVLDPGGHGPRYSLALDELFVREKGQRGRLVAVQAADRAQLASVLAGLAAPDTEVFPVLYPQGEQRSEESRRLLSPLVTVKFAAGFDSTALAAQPGVLSLRVPDYAPDHAILRTADGLASLDVAANVSSLQGVEMAEPQLAARPAKFQAMPDDTLIGNQWHLKFQSQPGAVAGTDINVESVWNYPAAGAGVRGRGVRLAIVDDSLQTTHPDLAPNYESAYSYDWNDDDSDPNPVFSDDNHGTSCAGDAAARGNNALGVSGSAPEAILVGMRLIAEAITDSQIADAMSWQSAFIDLKSNSWGFGPYTDNFPLTLASMASAASTGRGGLGTIFLFAAGNSGELDQSPNYNALQNSIYTICVGAFDSQGRQSFYSEPGANLLIAGPSNGDLPALGKTTTDRTGTDGYNSGTTAGELPDDDYTQEFGGTSSATPTVAGVVALMLEANPALGWRDVQEILLRSARKVVPADSAWITNEAGINHNPKFGAGLVDAAAAVALAETWVNLPAAITRTVPRAGLNLALPDNNPNGVSVSFNVPNAQNIRVEHVRLTINATHTYRGDLRIILRSPTGIESELAAPFNESGDNLNWTYTSVRNWGENGAGTWTLRVSDEMAEDKGVLNSATLILHGTPAAPIDLPPTVSLLVPQEGGVRQLIPGKTIVLTAQAADTDITDAPAALKKFEFLVDGAPFPDPAYVHVPVAPGRYEYVWTPPIGTYQVSARAIDLADKVGASAPATLDVDYPPIGAVREDFTPPPANDHVQALAADPDGRIYIGGRFTTLDGGSAPRVARLLPDGSVDPLFYVGSGPDAQVRALLHVPQDKSLYVGGHFANVAGAAGRALVRLSTGQDGVVDGSLDPAFAPLIESASTSSTPHVVALARQSDGKILVGGFFAKVNGVSRSNLARLLPDGTLDTSFAPNPTGAVHCLALQPDGKILVGGSFAQMAGQTARRIARLNSDGSVDDTFVTGSSSVSGGFDGVVNSIAVTLDGDVIVGGAFTSYNGRSFYNNLAKLLPNGTIDGKFNFTPGINGVVYDLHVRPTGRILVSGLFTEVANDVLGITPTSVGRVLQIGNAAAENGVPDASFNPGEAGADNSVLDSITLPSGDVLLAGAFTSFNGIDRHRLAVVAGYDGSSPMISSPLSVNIDAGADLSHAFASTGSGPFTYSRLGPPLPRGVIFNTNTGRLEGIPLDAGRYKFQVVATSPTLGPSDPTEFVLHVNDKKVPYAQWKKVWFPSPSDQTNNAVSGPSAVISNTAGLNNFLVYALNGGSPATADRSLVPVIRREIANGKTYLTLTASKYPGAEVTYQVQVSGDLATWGSSQPANVVTLSDTATQLKVRAATPATEIGKQFLRLKVLAP